jgi:hypothetical protein
MRSLAALLIFLIAFSAQAADDTAHKETAIRLTQMMMQFMGEDGVSLSCSPDRASFSAEMKRGYPARSSAYGGISPQSVYWPEIEELAYQYRVGTCPVKAITQGFAAVLARELTTADLNAAEAFYSSPVGRRLLAVIAKSGKESSALSRTTSPEKEAADLAYRTGLRALIAKYKSEPK